MGSMLRKIVVFGVGFVLLAAVTARAEVVEVHVPFAFEVNGEMLPAGDYRIERHAETGSVLLIRGERASQPRMFVVTVPVVGESPAGNTPVLTFSPDETHHRLTGIWESAGVGHELPGAATSSRLAQVIVVGQRVA